MKSQEEMSNGMERVILQYRKERSIAMNGDFVAKLIEQGMSPKDAVKKAQTLEALGTNCATFVNAMRKAAGNKGAIMERERADDVVNALNSFLAETGSGYRFSVTLEAPVKAKK